MAREQFCTDEVRREEIAGGARSLRKVEGNLYEVRLEFGKQSFRL
jgi:hypothetical protein